MVGYIGIGNFGEVFEFFNSMVEKKIEPTVCIYRALIDAFCKRGDVEMGVNLLHKMINEGIMPNTIVCNTLIYGFCKLGSTDRLKEMLSLNCKPDLVIYSSLIKTFCGKGRIKEAMKSSLRAITRWKGGWSRKVSREIMEDGALTSHGSISLILVNYCEANNVRRLSGYHRIAAQILIHVLVSGSQVNYDGYDLLIRGICQCGKIEDALRLTLVGLKNVFVPDSISYNFVLNGLCKDQRLEETKDLMNWLLDQNVVPDTNTYNVLIKCCCEKGNFAGAAEQY
ncbi:pentatricopeptide repeat-containing protein At1g64100-like [Aristolochia californica]|uniref:pentatricopeptide repeat-containing protein At1g64100-like n=1 Tax=Aristolochia californica TaxID=171875 RepID=UPI0035DD92BB